MIKVKGKFQELSFNENEAVEMLHDSKNSILPRKLIARLWKEKDEFGNLEFVGYDATKPSSYEQFFVTPSTILDILPTNEPFPDDVLFNMLSENLRDVSDTLKKQSSLRWKMQKLQEERGFIEEDLERLLS